MEPGVLAQHQVAELRRLRGKYERWISSLENANVPNMMAAVSLSQTRTMLRHFLQDVDVILEQK